MENRIQILALQIQACNQCIYLRLQPWSWRSQDIKGLPPNGDKENDLHVADGPQVRAQAGRVGVAVTGPKTYTWGAWLCILFLFLTLMHEGSPGKGDLSPKLSSLPMAGALKQEE